MLGSQTIRQHVDAKGLAGRDAFRGLLDLLHDPAGVRAERRRHHHVDHGRLFAQPDIADQPELDDVQADFRVEHGAQRLPDIAFRRIGVLRLRAFFIHWVHGNSRRSYSSIFTSTSPSATITA